MNHSDEEDCGFFKEEERNTEKRLSEDQSVVLPIPEDDRCMYCRGVPLDKEIIKCFRISVCSECNKTRLKFITKTTCKVDYLLNDEELKQFGCLSRPNPHKGTWNDMQLYLEAEIKRFSIEKYGSEAKVAEIKNEKKVKKKEAKLREIKSKVKELKRKTFLAPVKERRVHKFIKHGKNCSVCECGMLIEEEEL